MKESCFLFNEIDSSSEPLTNIKTDEISNVIEDKMNHPSFVVAYLDNEILVGRYKEGNFTFPEVKALKYELLQKMRIFNLHEELLIWRSGGFFHGRSRIDSEGNNVGVVDSLQAIVGTRVQKLGSYVKLGEDRGTELTLPFESLDIDSGENRLFIKTRNYVVYNEIGQATYEDVRFVSFHKGKNRKEGVK